MADELIALKPEIVAKARVTEAQRAAMYDAAAKNPEAFWREEAQRIAWMKAPTKIKNTDFNGNVSIKWFEDGVLNASVSCLDRHLATRGDQVAILWEGDDPAADARADRLLKVLRGRFRGLRVEIDAGHAGVVGGEVRACHAADAASRADDHRHMPRERLRLGHALQLRLLEAPVLDVERLLARQREVAADGFRALHHLDRAAVELRRRARLGLRRAPRDQADAGHEDHGRLGRGHPDGQPRHRHHGGRHPGDHSGSGQ